MDGLYFHVMEAMMMNLLQVAPMMLERISMLQMVVSFVMFFVLCFGIGFILNMILKTTWLPLMIYLVIAFYFLVFRLNTYQLADMLVLFAGLIGSISGGWTIHTLRVKGYRMF
jgi:Putative membrane protein